MEEIPLKHLPGKKYFNMQRHAYAAHDTIPLNSPVPVYTPGWKGALLVRSEVSFPRTKYRMGLERGMA